MFNPEWFNPITFERKEIGLKSIKLFLRKGGLLDKRRKEYKLLKSTHPKFFILSGQVELSKLIN